MLINKTDRILMLVESPNKTKTISSILKELGYKNIIVQASVGHISHLADSGDFNVGVDLKTFKMDLQITPDKKDIVSRLREQVRLAKSIILASDPDREGEAIAWSLKKFLNIPDDKYVRITYHEITKSAIEKALNNPRKLDESLIEASHTRNCLDKIVGYRLSPVARQQVNARSVGRCQSAGLKLVVDREKEIQDFKVEKYYELYLNFEKNGVAFKAKYIDKLKDLKACEKIIDVCNKNQYMVSNITKKEVSQKAPLPFTTSTLQQEASNKLNIGVKDVMSYAQKLFEGIDIGGKHIPLITYHRSDDTTIAPDFIPFIHEYIDATYGKNYISSSAKKAKKSESVQAGHEAIRVVDITMTPERIKSYISETKMLKLYELIFKRTVASQMLPRRISDTQYEIDNSGYKFIMSSKEELFAGWKRAYSYEKDTDEEIKETFKINEKLKNCELKPAEKETQPPARFTEATLIKTLDKMGIGRPSTYATIISTLLDEKRGYCVVDDKKMVPTPLAMKLINFLDNHFTELVRPDYTSQLEKSLDRIAEGELHREAFLKKFCANLNEDIQKVQPTVEEKLCPECGHKLVLRKGKFGMFLGCSNYPNCRHIENIRTNMQQGAKK